MINNMITDALHAMASGLEPQIEHDGIPYAVIPEGYRLSSIENMLSKPARTRSTVTVNDEDSFTRYFNQFKLSYSKIFAANIAPHSFTGIIDYHQAGSDAGWCQNKVVYTCPYSPEWDIWIKNNGKKMDQVSFAQFLEDNLEDIVDPSGADILTIANTLEMKKSVTFQSGTRLSDGQNQLVYQEDIKSSAAKGKMEIPEKFVVAISPFLGGEHIPMNARLRYRITQDGGINFWYDLLRSHKVVEEAFDSMVNSITDATKTDVFMGSASITPPAT